MIHSDTEQEQKIHEFLSRKFREFGINDEEQPSVLLEHEISAIRTM